MASSKVMSSTSPANPDLPRHSTSTATTSSTCSTSTTGLLQHSSAVFHPPPPHQQPQAHHHLLHHSDDHSFGSMNMEEILKNIYSDPDTLASAVDGDGSLPAVGAGRNNNVGEVGSKTVDEVWKEIVSGGGAAAGGGGGSHEPRMTLEDFLTKAGAVSEEDVRVPGVSSPAPPPVPAPAVGGGGGGGYGMEVIMNAAASGVQFPPVVHMQNAPGGFGMESQLGFGNRMVPAGAAGQIRGGAGGTGGGSGSGRGKRRAPAVEDVALDKATQQKQRRMIKNRESAARSRERKQAYTVELESLVTQLEEENARLLKEEADQKKKRFKQLMENLIPVVEQQRPPRVLRRVQSMSWISKEEAFWCGRNCLMGAFADTK
ncbi:bZIP transcription factor 12-like [Coffea eugenioides]|uniref:bZIP transcription factor 12-like n=1 Tax=Coffea eugenioides TaxID=49369 RepID=UPI000F614D89|nr:bZIP transcription factor 12-like [Coffea eugenioides]